MTKRKTLELKCPLLFCLIQGPTNILFKEELIYLPLKVAFQWNNRGHPKGRPMVFGHFVVDWPHELPPFSANLDENLEKIFFH
jgi:hypothetical protein